MPRAPEFPARLDAPEEVETPGVDDDRGARRVPRRSTPAATSKAMPVTKDDGTVVLALVRGDDRLEEAKLAAALGSGSRPSTEEEIRAAFGADPRLARPGRVPGRDRRRRDAARGAVRRRREPRRAGTCAASRRGRDLRAALRGHPRAGRGRPLPGVRRRAALPDRDRGRPHLQARDDATRRRSARRSSTRTAPRSRCSWAATASAPAGSWPRRSSSATTSTGSSGRRRSLRTMCMSSRCPGRRGASSRREVAERRSSGGARRPARRPRPAPGREVRRRRPDRRADPGHGRQEDARGRTVDVRDPGDRRRRAHPREAVLAWARSV